MRLRLPGNRFNSALGRAVARLGRAERATHIAPPSTGLAVYDLCAGPAGWLIRAINGGGDAAITLGDVVLFTGHLDPSLAGHRWLLAHEAVHVRQARRLGLLYLPLYLTGAALTLPLWLFLRLRGRRPSWHDLHPMEMAASLEADRREPLVARAHSAAGEQRRAQNFRP